jgi:hypothetical protein
MMATGLPTAAYGKAANGGDEYGVLWTQQGFADAAQQALRNLARAYQFRGGGCSGDACYPDCFALWPVASNGGWVAARLRDAGNDSLDRLHTLRIDAVFVDAVSAGDDHSRLLGFLEPDAWPSRSFDAHDVFKPRPISPSPAVLQSLARGQPAASTSSVLRAYHSAYYTQGAHRFDIVLDATGLPVSVRTTTVNAEPKIVASNTRVTESDDLSSRSPSDSMRNGIHRQSPNWLGSLIAGIVAMLVGGGAGLLWHKSQSDQAFRDLQNEFSRKEEQHARDLSEQQKAAQEAYDSLMSQTRQLREAEDSFRALAAEYGFTNAADMESELRKRGLSPRAGGAGEPRLQRLRRLYDSLGTELFSPVGTPPSPGGPPAPDKTTQPTQRPLLDFRTPKQTDRQE